jgi:MFS superfamily sulfate permease-like transporter
MLLLAASALEKMRDVPTMFWVKAIAVIGGFVLTIVLLRWIFTRVPKMIMIAVVLVTVGVVGFSWIYNRNEPAFLTPFIEPIAQFFPTKDGYEVRQASDPGKGGPKKSTAPAPTTPKR